MNAFAKVARWKDALQILQTMKEKGCHPDIVSYNSALLACLKGSKWDKVEILRGEMISQGIKPDFVTYVSLISAYGKIGNWEYTLSLLEDMHADSLQVLKLLIRF